VQISQTTLVGHGVFGDDWSCTAAAPLAI